MLVPLDDSPWHQLPTTFDHVGTSDPRFFDRFWFAASAPDGSGALQFTLGVYQNMNVVDGGFVVIRDGVQHNVRASRQLRPLYDTCTGPLRFDVVEPFRHIRLSVASDATGVGAELDWRSTSAPQEERHHFARRWGRVVEDYSRYDQIGSLSGWLEIGGERRVVDEWWSCRDHSWGVRERVGIPEPYTGTVAAPGASMFAFLFFSTSTHAGHVQATVREGAGHFTAGAVDLASGRHQEGDEVRIDAVFTDADRPRRLERATFEVVEDDGSSSWYEIERNGSAVAMSGLGYGGFDDGLGLGVHRGLEHLEHDVWDVSDPAVVVLPDGRRERPVHRIQPVRVRRRTATGESDGFGSLTFVAEMPLDGDGHLRVRAGH